LRIEQTGGGAGLYMGTEVDAQDLMVTTNGSRAVRVTNDGDLSHAFLLATGSGGYALELAGSDADAMNVTA